MNYVKKHGLFEEAKERYENTTNRWKDQWWAVICEIWDTCHEWRDKYELDKIAKTIIEKVKKVINGIIEKVPIVFAKGTKLCYLFKFYDENGDLLFSKVGTTERTIMRRLREEIRYYQKGGFNVYGATIESVFDTGDIEPEGAQDFAKGYFIKKFRNCYIRNDRFACDIDVDEFNNLISNYLAA